MRITKTMAVNAATMMANEKYDPVVKRAKEKLNSCVLETVKTIPHILIEVCEKYPDYIYCTNNVYMRWNCRNYSTTLPFKIPSYISNLDNEIYAKECKDAICKACQGVLTAILKRDELKKTLETTIFGLRTKARLEADFPEASKYIDWPVKKFVPAVPVPNEIRNLFQK